MKKYRLIMVLGLLLAGCKGPTGTTGPTGLKGDPGTGIQTFTKEFRAGAEPSTAYAGTTMNRVSSANVSTYYQNDGTLRVNNTTTDISKVLIRFNLNGWIPSNATISSAVLELVTGTTTSIATATTVGLHDMSIASMVDGSPQCIWTTTCTWDNYSTVLWASCGGPGSITSGYNYNSTPSDTVSIPTSVNGTNIRLAWNVAPATVQKWLDTPAKNNGFAITSENEGADSAGNIIFTAPNDSNPDIRPNLIVTYYIP